MGAVSPPQVTISAKGLQTLLTETRLYYTEHAQQRVFLAQPCEGDLHLAACTRKGKGKGGYAYNGGTSYRHQSEAEYL